MAKVNTKDFIKKMDALATTYSRIPTEIATIAVNFSKERFREQAWLDETKEPWKPRSRKRRGGKSRSQTLLVDTGRLKRSIRKIYVSESKVIIGTDVPYAQIHNDGGIIQETVTVKTHNRKEHTRNRAGRTERVRAHTVNAHRRSINVRIPKRQFIGNSYALERRMYLHIASRFAKALKS
ncbi:MAG: phage virion morphogenesis protein [Bacteroidales bacterium]|jgi:phage gpG-like protein|nr:phage virion morphogenesis protein [Bacteroidales bacterium]